MHCLFFENFDTSIKVSITGDGVFIGTLGGIKTGGSVLVLVPNPSKLSSEKSFSGKEVGLGVINGSGKKSHIDVVALNTALVLWVAGIEDDLKEGFNKALFSINQGDPWKKFLLLKNYLSEN